MATPVLDQFREPEYTGENRCLPCTVVNLLIAVAVSAGVAVVAGSVSSPTAGLVGGGSVFLASLLSIYLRGYLVPGTPELTKRYFPPWLLALFGKAPPEPVSVDSDLDPEEALVTAGALEPCADRDDLCLTEGFRESWYAEIERIERDGSGRERLLELLGAEAGEVRFEEYGDAFRARVDDRVVGRWESEAAYLADLGAARALESRVGNWRELSVRARSQLLSGLRLFIDSCPSCGGTPDFGTETVESCCSTHDVAAVSCDDCGARLFETRV
jgi:hypothetical protein